MKIFARLLGRSRSTISRELRRNGNRQGRYSSWGAYLKATARRKRSVRRRRIEKDPELHGYVREKLRPYWSPELTAAMWNREHPGGRIAFATIYRAIKGGLLTLVDRKSRMLLAVKVNDFSGGTLYEAVMRAFDGMSPKSLTFDNGSEFARWKDMERDLNAVVYFADPHSPWQRGSNENVNGVLRFFFPKGCDFLALSQKDIDRKVALINLRPRFCLGLRSPVDVFCCT